MSCTPIDKVRGSGLLTGREAVWATIRILKEFSLKDIQIYTNDNIKMAKVGREQARPYIQGLEAAGFVKQIDLESAEKINRWKLIKDIGVDAPRVRKDGQTVTQGRNTEQMWRTMRILKSFSAIDLEMAASTEEVKVTKGTAKDYIYNLHKVGYLHVVSPAKNSGGMAVYRLLPSMNTGPKPPKIQRIKQVFDANLNKVMLPKGGE